MSDEGALWLRIDFDQPAVARCRRRAARIEPSDRPMVRPGRFAARPAPAHRRAEGGDPQPDRRFYTQQYGLIEAEPPATIDPATILAFWLVGFEADSPENSGETCVVELFGDSISTTTSEVSVGVKAHHDRRLHDDMARVHLDLDASDWHTYSAEWTELGVSFFVDDDHIRTVGQRIAYPMQVMLDLFEFRRDGPV
jgi:hypothetical protein